MPRAVGMLGQLAAGVCLLAGLSALAYADGQSPADAKSPADVAQSPAGPLFSKPASLSAAFDAELTKLGQISAEQFADRFPAPRPYVEKLSFDPAEAMYFDALGRRFALKDAETALLRQNGFVATNRGHKSFAQSYYNIFSADLPVYITADSILHAWHRSFDAMLEETEEQVLAVRLEHVLAGMSRHLLAAKQDYGQGLLADSLTDADFFLGVARSLLAGNKADLSVLGQDVRIRSTFDQIQSLQPINVNLFGQSREMDASQFKPRGHYDKTPTLRRYFQAMMWCGRADLRIAGESGSGRELGDAIVLRDLLRRSDEWRHWAGVDSYLESLFGRTDSLTFVQLDDLLARAEIRSPSDLKTAADLARLQARIEQDGAGAQQIAGDIYVSPSSSEKARLPVSVGFFGQRFTLDSWVFSKTVYDDIKWNGQKIQRRIPSGLDVAFAVFANNHLAPNLLERINANSGVRFRDGLPYQHNLAAARGVIDSLPPSVWDASLSARWLGCLRALSHSPESGVIPQAAQTRAWALRIANTQLGSWSELRHDSILYAKQSYTRRSECDFPTGYVEPAPLFWARLEAMANAAGALYEHPEQPQPNQPQQPQEPQAEQPQPAQREQIQRQAARLELPPDISHRRSIFLTKFASRVHMLRQIAERQAAGEELKADEKSFLKSAVTLITPDQTARSGRPPQYNGWYFDLFYLGGKDADERDALVADVHTDVPDLLLNDPGCILHTATGDVDLLIVAIDRREERFLCAGPMFSHYEFTRPKFERLTDTEWKRLLDSRPAPQRPDWTRAYFAPQ